MELKEIIKETELKEVYILLYGSWSSCNRTEEEFIWGVYETEELAKKRQRELD